MPWHCRPRTPWQQEKSAVFGKNLLQERKKKLAFGGAETAQQPLLVLLDLPFQLAQQGAAGRCQADPLSNADEQVHAKMLLQSLDLTGNRTLSQMQLAPGLGDAEVERRRLEGLQSDRAREISDHFMILGHEHHAKH